VELSLRIAVVLVAAILVFMARYFFSEYWRAMPSAFP
jgi:hypothetical protein